MLTDFGLSPAVAALADRCAVPVQVEDTVGQRLPTAVETALYYAVSEALTNVVGAVGGVLELDSPPAGGTRLRARVPIGRA